MSIFSSVIILFIILLTISFNDNPSFYRMDKYFKQLSSAQVLDSTWTGKLIVDMPTPSQLIIPHNKKSIENNKSTVIDSSLSSDIIPLLIPPSNVTQLIMKDTFKYPIGCSFCFEGYNGVDDYEKLKNHIIDCASRTDGTQLTVAIHDEFVNQPTS